MILLNYLSILCVPEYYTVLYPLRFGKGIHDSVGAKSPLKAKLIFKFLNMYMLTHLKFEGWSFTKQYTSSISLHINIFPNVKYMYSTILSKHNDLQVPKVYTFMDSTLNI